MNTEKERYDAGIGKLAVGYRIDTEDKKIIILVANNNTDKVYKSGEVFSIEDRGQIREKAGKILEFSFDSIEKAISFLSSLYGEEVDTINITNELRSLYNNILLSYRRN